jgi:uncharacterized cupredoxin-like copper-binding protein
MRVSAFASVIALAAFSAPVSRIAQQPTTPASETITVRLSNFDFNPEHLRLKAGVPVRLHLANESGRGHDFSSPAFAASGFPPGMAAPPEGTVPFGSHQTVVPCTPGVYHLECTHFLHSLFGMHGTIEVIP